jgi:hypothetical protein
MQKIPQKTTKSRIFGVIFKLTHNKYPNKMGQLELFPKEIQNGATFKKFLKLNLGKFWHTLPLVEMANVIRKKMRTKKGGKTGILTLEGGIALMFLKSYTKLSDKKLVDRLNTDWAYQFFCCTQFNKNKWIYDDDFVGRWRRKLAKYLNWETIDNIQTVLASHWEIDIEEKTAVFMDATCYESYVRFPTDEKLLWESCEWVYSELKKACKVLGIRCPRSKYKDKEKDYLNYSKRRKKTHKLKLKMRKKLLYLLEKIMGYLIKIIDNKENILGWKEKETSRLEVIKKVLEQQKELFLTGKTAGSQRIVSLAKPYLRPIKRGKETHDVEFGAKAHVIQVGKISFLEHLSFNAFNEGTRLESAVLLHEKYFGKTTHLGADGIYATRSNRKYCKEKGIFTNFVPVGRQPKEESKKSDTKIMRAALNKERSTVLEGSFGTQKENYNLKKIKAKREDTEVLWIVFGIWTQSAVQISNIQEAKELKVQRKQAA